MDGKLQQRKRVWIAIGVAAFVALLFVPGIGPKDDSRASDKPQETFGTNATPEEFAAVSAANFIPLDRTQNFFTPTLVKLVRQNASQAEVTGLAPGSRIAVKGVAALKAQWLGE